MPSTRPLFLSSCAVAIFMSIAIFLSSCTEKSSKANNVLKSKLATVDSLYMAGERAKACSLLTDIRKQVDNHNPIISDYYCEMSERFAADPAKKNLYADSALAYFNTDSRIKEHPDEYFSALLTKGDACFLATKYVLALNYYYESKKILALGI